MPRSFMYRAYINDRLKVLWLRCPDLLSCIGPTLMIVWRCCGYDAPIFFLFHLISVFCMLEYVHSDTGLSSLYLTVCWYIRYRYPCSKAMDNTGTRVVSEILYRCHDLSLQTGWVCNLVSELSEHNYIGTYDIVNQSENGYGWDNYPDC